MLHAVFALLLSPGVIVFDTPAEDKAGQLFIDRTGRSQQARWRRRKGCGRVGEKAEAGTAGNFFPQRIHGKFLCNPQKGTIRNGTHFGPVGLVLKKSQLGSTAKSSDRWPEVEDDF